jgi:hypothetical protein
MIFFAVAFGLLVHVLFWGAGLALLAMPRPWVRFWPVLAAPAGFVLQSLVVWAGAYANLPGTDCYARWSEVLPLALLVIAARRRGWGTLGRDLLSLGAVWAATIVCLVVLVWPLARASKVLTTASLGSCDAADYAGGARMLMEFAHGDRSGFIGLTEVAGIMSVDNFFDFWLRLNHFTPSAVIALNGSVFGLATQEITGLLTMVFLASSLPVVFWLARAVMGYRGSVSTWIALLYGLSPITWYAVFHVAMAQLLAAQAIALLTWAGVALWRGRLAWRRGRTMGGVLALAYALVLGSYNFILLVGLVPAVAYAGGLALRRRGWRRLARWALLMVVPLLVSGVVFAERVAGLVERFKLFGQYDFGWRIPVLSPAGWLGMVAGTDLGAFSGQIAFVLSAAVVVLLVGALVAGARRRRRAAFMALCLTVPVLAGYGYLNLRGAMLGTNASYDAYKLFAVFYPALLAGFCYWVTLAASRRAWLRLTVWAFALVVTGCTINAAWRFSDRMRQPPLLVGPELVQVEKIEAMPGVASVNMLVPDMWSRLWANAFLLHKPQYFLTHTYEGRKNTPLRGAWDLNGGLIDVRLPADGSVNLNAHYSLTNTASPFFLRATLGDGWYDLERLPRGPTRWRWAQAGAALLLDNPQARPLHLVLRFNARSLVERDLQVWVGGQRAHTVNIGKELALVRVPEITIPPGATKLELRSSLPPASPGGGDTRALEFAAYGIEIEVRADGGTPEN